MVVVIAMVLIAAGCGNAQEIDVVTPSRGPLVESFTEPARTRLAETWPIAMPVSGRVGRIELSEGAPVTKGQPLAGIDLTPFEQAVAEASAHVAELRASITVKDDDRLENTALRNALLMVEATSETLHSSEAQIDAQRARADRAAREYARKQSLFAEGTIADNERDDAELEAETTLIDLRSDQFTLAALRAMAVAVSLGPDAIHQYLGRKDLEREVIVHQLAQAEARLARARHELALARLESPIDGVVLARQHLGDTYLAAGEPLLLLGDLGLLEVEADVLTQDALKLSEGSAVDLRPASGQASLRGHVRKIEPQGFTKLSSLGVEQQRVKVIVAFDDDPAGLGVSYRLQATFRTGEATGALRIPRYSVLQAPDGSHFVFVVEAGEVARRAVGLGLRGDLEIEVTSGLEGDEQIVETPDSLLEEGASVRAVPRP
jgi:HlyD family secretion protein